MHRWDITEQQIIATPASRTTDKRHVEYVTSMWQYEMEHYNSILFTSSALLRKSTYALNKAYISVCWLQTQTIKRQAE